MTDNTLNSLLNNGSLSESAKTAITEALKAKEEQIRDEMREEFAIRYEKDRNELVEAADMMIKDVLQEYAEEIHREKQNLVRSTIKATENSNKKIAQLEEMIETVLEEEMAELRDDRRATVGKIRDLEKLVTEGLKDTVKELHAEKSQLEEDRVRFKVKSEKELKEAKAHMLQKTAQLAENFIESTLTEELTQLKEEITEAKQNMLGRKIYEAFQVEFVASYFNETKEVKKFKDAIEEREMALSEAKKREQKVLAENKLLKESLTKQKDKALRERKLNRLLGSLGGEKRSIMADLLIKVPTDKLDESFKKYLPVLLEETDVAASKKRIISESNQSKRFKTMTGDRTEFKTSNEDNSNDELIQQFVQGIKP